MVVVGSASKNKDQKTPIIQPIFSISIQAPAYSNCHGEMVQRMAKKGARQGQVFYGCSQFPKSRGVVNVN